MARLIIHPGEHLADELQALGMSANELAKALGVPTNRVTEIIRGKRGISGDTALRLGRWFGTGPDIWMNLQKNYELRLAAQAIGEDIGVEAQDAGDPHQGDDEDKGNGDEKDQEAVKISHVPHGCNPGVHRIFLKARKEFAHVAVPEEV
jgi:addiction module HigA family antidote